MNELNSIEINREFNQKSLTRIIRIGQSDMPFLQDVLKSVKSNDPYQSSAAYFAMTGRRGLWMARDDQAAIIFCRHPNIEDTFLIFPPLGLATSDLYAATIMAIHNTGSKIQLARTERQPAILQSNSDLSISQIPEKHLDWAFPVHTLDTKLVCKHSGNKFQQFRTALNKLDRTKIKAIDFDPVQQRDVMFEVLQSWAMDNKEKIDPYESLLELFDVLPMHGRLIWYDGKPAGFSIWEETDPANGMANAHAHIGIHQVSGLSRFVMLDMCQVLETKGFDRVCIGGSETSGLNQFKQQLRPVESISLSSYAITPKPEALRLNPAETSHTRLLAPSRAW